MAVHWAYAILFFIFISSIHCPNPLRTRIHSQGRLTKSDSVTGESVDARPVSPVNDAVIEYNSTPVVHMHVGNHLYPEMVELPDEILDFYNLTRKFSLLYHVGYHSALKSARLGFSHKNVHLMLLGSTNANKSEFLNSLFHHGDGNTIRGSRRDSEKITEYVFSIPTPELGLRNTTVKIIDVPEFTTNTSSNNDILSGLQDFMDGHPELKSRRPNLVAVFANFDLNTLEIAGKENFMQLLDKMSTLKQRLFQSDYSNALFVGTPRSNNSSVPQKATDPVLAERYFRLALQRQFIIENAETLCNYNVPVKDVSKSDLFRSKLRTLFQKMGDSLADAILVKFVASLGQNYIEDFPHLISLQAFDLNSNHHFPLLPQETTTTEVNQILQGYVDQLPFQPYNHDVELEVLKKILATEIRNVAELPISNNAKLVKLFRRLGGNLNPEIIKLVSMEATLQIKPLALNEASGVAYGYDVLKDLVLSTSPFKNATETRPTIIGFSLPNFIEVEIQNDVVSIFENFNTEQDYFYHRMHRLNLRADFRLFRGKSPIGINILGNEESAGLLEFRKFKLSLNAQTLPIISNEFRGVILNLPKYDRENRNSVETWRTFFLSWGTHIVESCYGGGSVEIRLKSSNNSHEAVPRSLMSLFPKFDSTVDEDYHWNKAFTLVGGSSEFGKLNVTSSNELRAWEKSLLYNPKILSNGRNYVSIVEIIKRISLIVADEAAEAIEDYLLGNMFQAANQSAEMQADVFVDNSNYSIPDQQFESLQEAMARNFAGLRSLEDKINAFAASTNKSDTNIDNKMRLILANVTDRENSMTHLFSAQSVQIENESIASSLDEIQDAIIATENLLNRHYQVNRVGQQENAKKVKDFLTNTSETLREFILLAKNETKATILDEVNHAEINMKNLVQNFLKNNSDVIAEHLNAVKNAVLNLTLQGNDDFQSELDLKNNNFKRLTGKLEEMRRNLDIQQKHFYNISLIENTSLMRNSTEKLLLAIRSMRTEGMEKIRQGQFLELQKLKGLINTESESIRQIIQDSHVNVERELISAIWDTKSDLGKNLSILSKNVTEKIEEFIMDMEHNVEVSSDDLVIGLNNFHHRQNQMRQFFQDQIKLEFEKMPENLFALRNKSEYIVQKLIANQTIHLISKLESIIQEHDQNVRDNQGKIEKDLMTQETFHAGSLAKTFKSIDASKHAISNSVADTWQKVKSLMEQHFSNSSLQKQQYYKIMESHMNNETLAATRKFNILTENQNNVSQGIKNMQTNLVEHETLEQKKTSVILSQLVLDQVGSLMLLINSSSQQFRDRTNQVFMESTAEILFNLANQTGSINTNMKNANAETFESIFNEIHANIHQLRSQMSADVNNSTRSLLAGTRQIANLIEALDREMNMNFNGITTLRNQTTLKLSGAIVDAFREIRKNSRDYHDSTSRAIIAMQTKIAERIRDLNQAMQSLVDFKTAHPDEVRTLRELSSTGGINNEMEKFQLRRTLRNMMTDSENDLKYVRELMLKINREGENLTSVHVMTLMSEQQQYAESTKMMIRRLAENDEGANEEKQRHDALVSNFLEDFQLQKESYSRLLFAAQEATREDMNSKNQQNTIAVQTLGSNLIAVKEIVAKMQSKLVELLAG